MIGPSRSSESEEAETLMNLETLILRAGKGKGFSLREGEGEGEWKVSMLILRSLMITPPFICNGIGYLRFI